MNLDYIYDSTKCDAPNFLVVSKEDKNGFFVSKNDPSPSSIRYCLPAAKRAFKTNRDLRIECDRTGEEYFCSTWFRGKKIEVGYSFQMSKFPESDFRSLDARMHEFYSYIILSEELE